MSMGNRLQRSSFNPAFVASVVATMTIDGRATHERGLGGLTVFIDVDAQGIREHVFEVITR